ncbi:MAG: 30S ribosomal protein S9 [Rhodothermaceae bacterium TMED105]|nr:MAG: 30S ribosomal protein S9 [Rhodothermaceae bacterium TMED105]|tara:strand:- start:200 stop:589 length:390 start_codon:yes stop_codon:yes gene_type:complete
MEQQSFVGRRKTSTARLYIKDGKGSIVINGKTPEEYLLTQANVNVALLPLRLTETESKYDIKVNVKGGGVSSQAGAIQHALARAVDGVTDGEFHTQLKQKELLTRDDRMVERKKYGQPKARKRFQFSKR